VRLFAAADIPAAVRAPLASWGAACADAVPGLRAIPEERLHLTLVFLGSRDDAEAPGIGELVTACADGPVEVALGEPQWLSPRRPHVLTVAVTDPSGRLADLQARVSAALEAGVGHEAERRRWRPHVTVARVRRGAGVRPGDVALPRVPSPSFALEALTLYRSHPGPAPRYEALARTRLE
jgi:RNA 2',3'-cyclic 3'-phosphodiesterase